MTVGNIKQKENVYEIIKSMRYPVIGKKMKWNVICKKLGDMQDDKKLDYPVQFSKKNGSWLSVFYSRLDNIPANRISTEALGKITHILSTENISSQSLGRIIQVITKL